jgi:effector-binding domain-containing protein
MINAPDIRQTEQQRTAVIRLTIPRSEIQQVMGPAIGEVMGAVSAQGIRPTGPVFSHHFKMDPNTFDFEVGVPVSAPIQPTGRVINSTLPPATVAHTTYHGPYEGLGDGWCEFTKWIEAEGHSTHANLWENYAKGPESSPDPTTWCTELFKPIKG